MVKSTKTGHNFFEYWFSYVIYSMVLFQQINSNIFNSLLVVHVSIRTEEYMFNYLIGNIGLALPRFPSASTDMDRHEGMIRIVELLLNGQQVFTASFDLFAIVWNF